MNHTDSTRTTCQPLTRGFRFVAGALAVAAWLLTLPSGEALAALKRSDDAPGPKFAVLSYIGEWMEVVKQPYMSTGTNIQQTRKRFPITTSVVDDAALVEAGRGLQKARPGTVPAMLAFDLPALREINPPVAEILAHAPATMAKALKAEKVTDLLLIVKTESPAQFEAVNANHNFGHVEGLGFFSAWAPRGPQFPRRNESAFVAPYASIRLVHVKFPEMTVVKEATAVKSQVIYVNDPRHPMEALSEKAQIAALQQMTSAAIKSSLPDAIAP